MNARDFPPHFSLNALTRTQQRGLDNTPSPALINKLYELAMHLERVRTKLGNKPMYVSSGYRSPAVNHAVGGQTTSQHMSGEAADFDCEEFGTPLEICEFLKQHMNELDIDQLIHEWGRWVHISFGLRKRRTLLTIDSRGATYGITPAVIT